VSHSYETIDALAHILLEDSWVLGIAVTPDRVEFELEYVLLETHPLYKQPPPHEAHCYVRGTLSFADVRRVAWSEIGAPPATDATGGLDFGHIDVFTIDDGVFALVGDFGELEIVSSREPVVTLHAGDGN
jgi:hypothetical protein